MTFFTLLSFVVCIVALTIFGTRELREDMQAQLEEQQLATTAFLATHVNENLQERLIALEKVAKRISYLTLENPAQIQEFLDKLIIINTYFNAGAFVTGLDGVAIASTPLSVNRIGVNYADRDSIGGVLKSGKPRIGKPVTGKVLGSPLITIAVPIRDAQSRLIGVLSGVIDLGKPSFLDKFTQSSYGKTGYFLLEDPKNKIIITATDKSRIMQAIKDPVADSLMYRHLHGYEGAGITTNPLGVEVLASARKIPIADWILIAALPTAEAFAPIRATVKKTAAWSFILILLTGCVIWWLLRYELSPMFATLKKLSTLSVSGALIEPLPIESDNEIGELITGFNHLLETMAQQRSALEASEYRWKFAIEGSGDGIWDWNIKTGQVYFSKAWKEILGFSEHELANEIEEWQNRVHPDDKAHAIGLMQEHLDGKTPDYQSEYRLRCKDGSYKWIFDRGLVVNRSDDNKPLRVIGMFSDITARKRAEEKVLLLSAAIEQGPTSVAITNLKAEIEYVNEPFTKIAGYDVDDVLGKNPRVLQSGLTDKSVYAEMWGTLTKGQPWVGEFINKRKNGEIYYEQAYLSPVKDNNGVVTHYVAVKLDITDRKRLEEEIRQLAFHDALTKLPNRRLLVDHLNQAIVSSRRNGCFGALMFLDLDNFKPLNDLHGHAAGDLLLIEVANRLKHSVREMDTVARIGGDEFVVMLSQLVEDEAVSKLQAGKVAEKILASLSAPYLIKVTNEQSLEQTVEHHCSASIGVTLFSGNKVSEDELMRRADDAMYQAKEAGRNQFKFYTEG